MKSNTGLHTYRKPSHPEFYFRCCRIFPEYEQKFVTVPAMFARNSQITSHTTYLAVDTKGSFTDYGSFIENELLRH